jgi:uncharacterized protein
MTAPAPSVVVVDNVAKSRYEAHLSGDRPSSGERVAVATYERHGGEIRFLHTYVPPALEGHGVASRIARAALDDARQAGLAVVPLCPFFAAYIRRHREYEALVPAALRDELLRRDAPADDR